MYVTMGKTKALIATIFLSSVLQMITTLILTLEIVNAVIHEKPILLVKQDFFSPGCNSP